MGPLRLRSGARETVLMTRPDWASPEIDLTRPSPARMYDYNLGGSHNFAVDRIYAKRMNEAIPDLSTIHRANRSFLRRVVRFLANSGIRQFLDIGSGIPTVGNVHEIAQQLAPESRVVYVDIDSVAVIHGNAILAGNDRAAVVRADVRDAAGILADPTVRSLIDFTQPVGVLMLTVLHFVSDQDNPLDVVRNYRDAMCPASYLAISYATTEGRTGDQLEEGLRVSARNRGVATMRGRADLPPMFEGFDILEPGVVFTPAWRPDSPGDYFSDQPDRAATLAAVGVKR